MTNEKSKSESKEVQLSFGAHGHVRDEFKGVRRNEGMRKMRKERKNIEWMKKN